jgi:hypothetical protein
MDDASLQIVALYHQANALARYAQRVRELAEYALSVDELFRLMQLAAEVDSEADATFESLTSAIERFVKQG